MPTLSELKVRSTYDGSNLRSGLQQSKQEVQQAAQAIKQSMDAAEASAKASTTKLGQAYAALPPAVRSAFDEAERAQMAYQQRVTTAMRQTGIALSVAFTAPFAIMVKDAISGAGKFEQSMDVLQVSIHASGQQMEQLRQKAVDLGRDLTLPATSSIAAAEAMRQLAKGGLDVANTLTAARGTMQLAAATGVSSAEAATMQARALSAFNLKGTEATHVADLLTRATYTTTGTIQDFSYALQASGAVMHAAHQSITDTTTALAEMAKAGVVGSDAGTSLKQMFLRLEEGGSLRRVRDILHGYGIEIYDTSGHMKDMRQIIEQFAPMFDHLTEKQRNAALALIFGTDAVRSAQIVLGGGVKAFDEMKASLDVEGSAAELAAARNKGLAGSLDALKSAWDTFLQQSAEPLLKPLAGMVHNLGDIVSAAAVADPAVRNVAMGVGLLVAAAGPALIVTAQLKTAYITLFGIRMAQAEAEGAEAAATAGLTAAQSANTAAATADALANQTLADVFAEELAETAPLTAGIGALAVAQEGAAVAAGTAAAGVGAMGAAEGVAAASTGVLAGALAFLATPVGIAVLAVAALATGLYFLSKANESAEEKAKALRKSEEDAQQTTYELAITRAKLAHETQPLIDQYIKLADKTRLTKDEAQKMHDLENDIATKMPELVKAYTSQGDAILDVAKAHAEAAAQAQNQYDKEMQLAGSRLSLMKSEDAANQAHDLRTNQGAGRSQADLRAGLHYDKGMFTWDKSVWGENPDGPLFQAMKTQMMLQARDAIAKSSKPGPENLWQAPTAPDPGQLRDAQRAVDQAYMGVNSTLRQAVTDAATAKAESDKAALKAKLGPAGYAKYQQDEATRAEEAGFQAEADKKKLDAAYQARHDAWFKAHGYTGIDELAKTHKEVAKTHKEGLGKDKEPSLDDDMAALARAHHGLDALLTATGAMLAGSGGIGQRVLAGGGYILPPGSKPEVGDIVLGGGIDQASVSALMAPVRRSGPASIRSNNPGAMWDNGLARQFGSHGHETLNDGLGQGNQIALFDNPVSGAAAQFALLAQKYVGLTLAQAINRWDGGNGTPGYLSTLRREAGLSPDTVLSRQMIFGPEGMKMAKTMAGVEAGKPYPMTDQQWQLAQQLAMNGGRLPASAGQVEGIVDASGRMIGADGRARNLDPMGTVVRPLRKGKYGNEKDVLDAEFQAQDKAYQKQRDEEKQKMAAVDEAYYKHVQVMADATDAQKVYADMLGLTVTQYKMLTKEQQDYVQGTMFVQQSQRLTDTELGHMKASSAAGLLDDPVARAVAEFQNSLADRKDLTEADKMRLVEEKRTDLITARKHALDVEVQRMQDELRVSQALTEEERIRLKIKLAHPGMSDAELAPLVSAETTQYHVVGQKKVDEEAAKMGTTTADDQAKLDHEKALYKIQSDQHLTELARKKLIEDQNDALAKQLYLLQLQAQLVRGDITPAQLQQLQLAHDQEVTAARKVTDQKDLNNLLAEYQKQQDSKLREQMKAREEEANTAAGRITQVLMKPFEDGLQHGLRGFWQSLVKEWENVVKQMALEWMKGQLMRAIQPNFEGGQLRQYKEQQAAQAAAEDQARKKALDAAKQVAQAVKDAKDAAPKAADQPAQPSMVGGTKPGIDPMGVAASLALLFGGGGKHSLLQDLLGVVGLLGSTGAFGSHGWMHFAAGGQPPIGRPVVVGEFGPELFIPDSQGRILSNSASTAAMSGGGHAPVIHVTQNITTPDPNGFRRSSSQVAGAMVDALARQNRRSFAG